MESMNSVSPKLKRPDVLTENIYAAPIPLPQGGSCQPVDAVLDPTYATSVPVVTARHASLPADGTNSSSSYATPSPSRVGIDTDMRLHEVSDEDAVAYQAADSVPLGLEVIYSDTSGSGSGSNSAVGNVVGKVETST